MRDGEKVLLGHRASKKDAGGIYEPDSWTLSGGKQEYDETILECAKREVKEKTDLDVSELEAFNVVDDIQKDRHFVNIQVIANKFSGIAKTLEVDRIDEWKWFDINKLPENLYSPTKKFLDQYKKKINE